MSSNEPTRSNAAGAALTYPMQASHIHKGDFIVIENRPCKCVHSTCLKNGKHGHAKAVITAIDIFTGRKHVTMVPASHPVDVPHVVRADFPVVCIHEDTGMLSLLADDGSLKEDIALDACTDEVRGFIEARLAAGSDGSDLVATVLGAMGEERIVACKACADDSA